jgi:hypothetical protein
LGLKPECIKQETDSARRNGETAIEGRYAMRRVVLTQGTEKSATGVSLTALTERVHSDAAIPPRRKCFLLMPVPYQKYCVCMAITFENENNVIVYVFEQIMSYAW